MKEANVTLAPLSPGDRAQFILDNQRAFLYGAQVEFGMRDDHADADGEIISRRTIEACMDRAGAETYRILLDGQTVGGTILHIDRQIGHNELEILFVLPEFHSLGIGYGAWRAIEALHPETKVWKTCTPYFEKRNIHFYVNKCGFRIDAFWCAYFRPAEPCPEEASAEEGPDEMFHFIKVME